MTISVIYPVVKISEFVYYQEGPGIRNHQNTPEGTKFLNIRCFVNGRLDTASMKKISESEAFGKYKHFLLDAGDYVVSSSGTLGRIAEVYPEDLPVMLNTSTIRFRPKDEESLDRLYLRYFLESENFQQQVKSLATGSVQLNYGPSHLAHVEMPLPPMNVQRAIGQVLDSITRKIDLNASLAKTLEDIAQTIFKSWFIDFDPVKAKMTGEPPVGMDDATAALFPDSMEESEPGLIPKGWQHRKVEEVLSRITTKGLPKSTALMNLGRTLVLGQGNSVIAGFIDETADIESSSESPAFVFGDHTCRMRLSTLPFSIFPNTIVLTSDIRNPYWAYGATSGLQKFETYRRHWMELAYKVIVVPSCAAADAYGKEVRPLYELIDSLLVQSRVLSALRDDLLPRLISGELQIPEEMMAS